MKKLVLFIIKAAIAAVAMYLALRKVDWKEWSQLKWSESLLWLLPALLLFNLSQLISAYRLWWFYKVYLPLISYLFNVRLYYKGMFYNLFLPGGIGGDAYKVIALKNENNSYRQLAAATLLDRITGLLVLLLILSLLTWTVSLEGLFDEFLFLLPVLTFTGIPVYWLFTYRYFRPFNKLLPMAAGLSIFVQAIQFMSFCCILYALNVKIDSVPVYAFLFFTSSVISALPISIGGIGTRELALATGAAYFDFSTTNLVAASLLFFLQGALSAIAGWAISQGKQRKLA